jgi:hypothetical protein
VCNHERRVKGVNEMPTKPKTVKTKKPRDLRDLKPTKDAKGGCRKAGGDPKD